VFNNKEDERQELRKYEKFLVSGISPRSFVLPFSAVYFSKVDRLKNLSTLKGSIALIVKDVASYQMLLQFS